MHVCVDDHSRVGFAQIYPDETGDSVTAPLETVVAYFRQLGVHVTGVITDNGPGYRSRRIAECCACLGLRHLYTRPYTPHTTPAPMERQNVSFKPPSVSGPTPAPTAPHASVPLT